MSSDDHLLDDALLAAAREIGNAMTPDDLKRRNVRRVRFVPREKLGELLEKAVEKALAERAARDSDVSAVVDVVQAGLLGLLRGAHEVETARASVTEHRHALEGELAELVEALQGRNAGRDVRERDIAIDKLERRVRKLVTALAQTEQALQRALVSRNIDEGIASLYRVVQGLSPDDPQADQKREMMAEIFRANVVLRSAILGEGGDGRADGGGAPS